MIKSLVSLASALFTIGAMADPPICDPAMMDQAWNQCAVCHSVVAGDTTKFGPNLNGVLGRRSGSLPGYVFSPAMAKSYLTWTRSTLDVFLRGPQLLVPDSRMPFGALRDAQMRSNIICKLANSNH